MTRVDMAQGYEPRFDIDAAVGHQGEMFCRDVIGALREGRVEVKTDRRFADTGNLYVEHACLKRGEWTDSGRITSDAEVWFFVIEGSGVSICVTAEALSSFLAFTKPKEKQETDGSHPTKGFLVHVSSLIGWARKRVAA